MCRAVAAAERRAACALALASFWAQSGRILSVVMTLGSVAEREVALRRPVSAGAPLAATAEFREELEDPGDSGDAECKPLGLA